MSALPGTGDAMAMLARLAEARGVPVSAGIEISDRCNEVCVHCYQEQGRKGEMNTAEVFGVIDQLADMGVLMLTLSGGETTLRKDFLEIVAHARARGFALRVFTNGLTMTRDLAQALGRLAVKAVEISIYSTRAEMHDFVTGVKGSFDRSTAGVRHLVEAGVAVTIKAPIMSLNEGETEAYAEFATSLGATYSFSPDELMPREGGDRSPEAFTLSDASRVEISRALAQRPDDCGAEDYASPLDGKPCGAGRLVHVEPNGELRPCTMLELDLGHALRDGIAVAHSENDAARSLRELTWAQLPGCRECDLRAHCQRCYAASLAQTGDALAPYEGGCCSARLNYEINTSRAARIVAKSDRNVTIGPYREIAEGVFEPFDHIITPEDDALARRLGWVRRSSGVQTAPAVAARPGELIQIRRPGRTKPKLERIPVGTGVSSTVEVARHTTETNAVLTTS